jgi:hypothetical protein
LEQRVKDEYHKKMGDSNVQIKNRLYYRTVRNGCGSPPPPPLLSHTRARLTQIPSLFRLNWPSNDHPHLGGVWRLSGSAQEEEVQELFDGIDQDHSGMLNVRELQKLFKVLQVHLLPKEVENAMAEIDATGDGEISLQELKEWLVSRELWDPARAANIQAEEKATARAPEERLEAAPTGETATT